MGGAWRSAFRQRRLREEGRLWVDRSRLLALQAVTDLPSAAIYGDGGFRVATDILTSRTQCRVSAGADVQPAKPSGCSQS